MYGEKRELITFQCRTCNAACPVWVDREDLERVKLGVLVRNAFANRGGESYLTAAERELFISGTCDSCWQTLRPAVAHASCKRCGKSVGAPSLCEECFEIAQLCGLVRDFAAAVPHFTGMNAKAKLLDDFARVVIVFGVADGSLSPSELAILGDLLCYLEPEDVTGANAMQISFGYADCILKENPKPVPEAPCSMTALDSHDRATGTHYGPEARSDFVFALW